MRVPSANVTPWRNRMNCDQALGSSHLSPKESCWLEHTAPEKDLWKVGKSTNTKHVQHASARKEGGKRGGQNNRGEEAEESSVRTCWGRAENRLPACGMLGNHRRGLSGSIWDKELGCSLWGKETKSQNEINGHSSDCEPRIGYWRGSHSKGLLFTLRAYSHTCAGGVPVTI